MAEEKKITLSENEQQKIALLAGRLAAVFEDLHGLHGKGELISEDDCVSFTYSLIEMFSEQDANLSVDLFKNIYNRSHL